MFENLSLNKLIIIDVNCLQIEYKECKGNKRSSVFEVMAHKNTWSHQRQKRRQQKKYERQQTLEGNNSCETSVSDSTDTRSDLKGSGFTLPETPSPTLQSLSQTGITLIKRKGDEEYENNNKRLKKEEDESLQMTDDLLDYYNQTHNSGSPNEGSPQSTSQSELYSQSVKSGCIKMSQNLKINESAGDRFEENKDDKRHTKIVDNIHENEDCDPTLSPDTLQKRDDTSEGNSNSYLLNALVSVCKVGPDIVIEMSWLEGTHGRDAMHQVMQYIKNNLKIE
jgi:hypothetical protein